MFGPQLLSVTHAVQLAPLPLMRKTGARPTAAVTWRWKAELQLPGLKIVMRED